jgi:hypothetical protein
MHHRLLRDWQIEHFNQEIQVHGIEEVANISRCHPLLREAWEAFIDYCYDRISLELSSVFDDMKPGSTPATAAILDLARIPGRSYSGPDSKASDKLVQLGLDRYLDVSGGRDSQPDRVNINDVNARVLLNLLISGDHSVVDAVERREYKKLFSSQANK